MAKQRIYLFDTTLRDGAQTRGVDFTVADKEIIARALDDLGVDYIEGGWPGANPTDTEFFKNPKKFNHAQFVAFGMTRRAGVSADNDPGLRDILASTAGHACLVGKTWDKQIKETLNISTDENLKMVAESMAMMVKGGKQVMLDAEHFFDGYLSNPGYAIELLQTALQHGAKWVVLCDTRGGMTPHNIGKICNELAKKINLQQCGIHAHNDTDCAVANSLMAVECGVGQVQGTINGLGERCGNANILSVMANLHFKLGYDIGPAGQNMHKLKQISGLLDERIARNPNIYQAFVGNAAFAHKGGLHASAVAKDPSCYEHINPEWVGNKRHILVSNQSGKSNIRDSLSKMGFTDIPEGQINQFLEEIKNREFGGWSYDGADASFELMVHRILGRVKEYFVIDRYRVISERRNDSAINESEANIYINVNQKIYNRTALGNGPVNALDSAFRKVLIKNFPQLEGVHLADFRVRIIPPPKNSQGTDAKTLVSIDSVCGADQWTTVGLSENIIDAAMLALHDAYQYRLMVLDRATHTN